MLSTYAMRVAGTLDDLEALRAAALAAHDRLVEVAADRLALPWTGQVRADTRG